MLSHSQSFAAFAAASVPVYSDEKGCALVGITSGKLFYLVRVLASQNGSIPSKLHRPATSRTPATEPTDVMHL